MSKRFFFIVGAPKAGTYSLYEYLRQHSRVCMSTVKEPTFFVKAIDNAPEGGPRKRVPSTLEEYLRLFDTRKTYDWRGEATPCYLRCKESPHMIWRFCNAAKIIITLREPVDRAFSNWKMDRRFGIQEKPFVEAFYADMHSQHTTTRLQFEYYKASLYAKDVQTYYDVFGPENVQVHLLEDLKSNPQELVSSIQRFLGVQTEPLRLNRIANEGKLPRNSLFDAVYRSQMVHRYIKPCLPRKLRKKSRQIIFSGPPDRTSLDSSTRVALNSFFHEDIQKLGSLINRDLSHWILR